MTITEPNEMPAVESGSGPNAIDARALTARSVIMAAKIDHDLFFRGLPLAAQLTRPVSVAQK